MSSKAIKVQITRFISADNPGFIECVFTDAHNKLHMVHEKIPVITAMNLSANTQYPIDAFIACKILEEWCDEAGRNIVRVSTSEPWSVETTEELTEFDVLDWQLINTNHVLK